MTVSSVVRGHVLTAAALALVALPALALDLETVLQEVAQANPTLAAQSRMVEAARHRVGPAGAWASPMVEVGVMNVPTTGRFDEVQMTMKTIGVSQTLPLFGNRGLERHAARARAHAASAGNELAHYELYGAAWDAYAKAYYARALVREVQQHRGIMQRLVRAARARYQTGSGRLDDVLRAEAGFARTLSDQAAFEADEIAARAQLAALRGLASDSMTDSLAPPPPVAGFDRIERWIASIDSLHPALREHAAQASGSRLAAQAARRRVWPELRLRASYGFREQLASGLDQKDLFSASVGFELPLFASSRQLAQASEMEARARGFESRRQAELLRLHQDVRGAHGEAVAALRMVGLLADTVVATQRSAMDASWSAYRAGSVDMWRVFEAAHALHVEEVALLGARLRLSKAQAHLLAYTARGDLLGVRLPDTERSEQ